MNTPNVETAPIAEHEAANYEAPRIEEVLTPETLEREVAYAGNSNPSQLA